LADLRGWRYRQAGPPLITRQRRPYRCPSALNNQRKRMSARPWVLPKGSPREPLRIANVPIVRVEVPPAKTAAVACARPLVALCHGLELRSHCSWRRIAMDSVTVLLNGEVHPCVEVVEACGDWHVRVVESLGFNSLASRTSDDQLSPRKAISSIACASVMPVSAMRRCTAKLSTALGGVATI
jgi:hypothetical protein